MRSWPVSGIVMIVVIDFSPLCVFKCLHKCLRMRSWPGRMVWCGHEQLAGTIVIRDWQESQTAKCTNVSLPDRPQCGYSSVWFQKCGRVWFQTTPVWSDRSDTNVAPGSVSWRTSTALHCPVWLVVTARNVLNVSGSSSQEQLTKSTSTTIRKQSVTRCDVVQL